MSQKRAIAEILGVAPDYLEKGAIQNGQCPFLGSKCIKSSPKSSGAYPVCSVWQGINPQRAVVVCPKRFLQAQIIQDAIRYCWPGLPPTNPKVAKEVKLEGLGFVDLVIADVNPETTKVVNFLSIELQALDITGSVHPEFMTIVHNDQRTSQNSYGLNFANVKKRYVTQLIQKGFFHHHWNSKIVAVVQDILFEYLRKSMSFDLLPIESSNANVVFMTYRMVPNVDKSGHSFEFAEVIATSHNSLMMASLYRTPPAKETFHDRILKQLSKKAAEL
jgi:Restriction endonuclease NotI